jgi:hypothetical protein
LSTKNLNSTPNKSRTITFFKLGERQMASIQISELRPAGFELFQDSESFLNELGDRELAVSGGRRGGGFNSVNSVISQATVTIGISILSASVVTQVKY